MEDDSAVTAHDVIRNGDDVIRKDDDDKFAHKDHLTTFSENIEQIVVGEDKPRRWDGRPARDSAAAMSAVSDKDAASDNVTVKSSISENGAAKSSLGIIFDSDEVLNTLIHLEPHLPPASDRFTRSGTAADLSRSNSSILHNSTSSNNNHNFDKLCNRSSSNNNGNTNCNSSTSSSNSNNNRTTSLEVEEGEEAVNSKTRQRKPGENQCCGSGSAYLRCWCESGSTFLRCCWQRFDFKIRKLKKLFLNLCMVD